jgi:hypothetical protein
MKKTILLMSIIPALVLSYNLATSGTVTTGTSKNHIPELKPPEPPKAKQAPKSMSKKTYKNTKQDKPIIITNKNSHITIKLKENTGSTGYQWFLEKYDHNLLELYQYAYIKPIKNIPGAAGDAVFDFLLKNDFKRTPQITRIEFIKARPWDLDGKATKEYKVISVGR